MKPVKDWKFIAAALALGLAISLAVPAVAQHFGAINVLDGSPGAPSLTFVNAATRGFFSDTANVGVGFTVGGNQVGGFNATSFFSPSKIRAYPTTAPVCTGCGGAQAQQVAGSDSIMRVTMSANGAVPILLTFNTANAARASCVANIQPASDASNNYYYITSIYSTLTTIRVNASGIAANEVINIFCPVSS